MKFIQLSNKTILNDLWIERVDNEEGLVYIRLIDGIDIMKVSKKDLKIINELISYDLDDLFCLIDREIERRKATNDQG